MRHDVERYKMLLETETNRRVRKVLTGMIEELESRVSAPPDPSPAAAPPPMAGGEALKPRTYFPV
ncbi:MAG TPA: hypothetical protein VH020_08205 [Stellaceae bacterium]|jgi:hypothetical protein|nr:hypothetical protein [Stellaceae bacterium]